MMNRDRAPIDHDFDLSGFMFELLAGFICGAWLLSVCGGLYSVYLIVNQ